jgi:hypothetical protein
MSIEIENSTDAEILATACRSKTTGKLYIHIGKAHGKEQVIKPHDSVNVDINEVLY